MLTSIIAIVVMVGLDQLFKHLASTYLVNGSSVIVIPGILEFRYVENRGAAFSLLSGQQGILIAVTSIALLAIAYIIFIRKPKNKLELTAYILIFSGGLGNLIDRVLNRYVVDFINFLFVQFAVFNIADIFVTCGFVLLIYTMIREEIVHQKTKKDIIDTPELEESEAEARQDDKKQEIH